MTQATLELARQHHAAGRLNEAKSLYREMLATEPGHPETLGLLGLVNYQLSEWDDAVAVLRRAVSADPKSPEFQFNLGLALAAKEDWAEASAAFHKSVDLRPDFAAAHNGLGNALRNLRKFDEAIAAHERAVALQPDSCGYWSNLGIALQSADRYPQAIAAFGNSLSLKPDYAEAWCNLGNALWRNGDLEKAAHACRRALALRGDFAEAYSNLGNVLQSLGQYAAAREAFERGLHLQPESAGLHYNFSMLLLLQGDFRRGWEEYEWRRRVPEFRPTFPRFEKPMWDGRELGGRRILIYTEQGFGDAIHFARYLPAVAERGGKIILHCQSALTRLFQSIAGVQTVLAGDQTVPEFDVYCPLLSLPHVLGIARPEDLPWHGLYLHGDAATGRKFRDLLNSAQGRLKIGLVWTGRGHLPGRSVPLGMLAPLADDRAQFYSLQLEKEGLAFQSAPAGMNLIDAAPRLGDFADTAALMEQLDLIVSIDTAAAQLAGALGRPVWTLLKFVPDWRWMLERADPPWYPTMRLFRQQTPGDWVAPVKDMATELRKLLDSRTS